MLTLPLIFILLPLAVKLFNCVPLPTFFSKVKFPVPAFRVKLLLPSTVSLKVIPFPANVGLFAMVTLSL